MEGGGGGRCVLFTFVAGHDLEDLAHQAHFGGHRAGGEHARRRVALRHAQPEKAPKAWLAGWSGRCFWQRRNGKPRRVAFPFAQRKGALSVLDRRGPLSSPKPVLVSVLERKAGPEGRCILNAGRARERRERKGRGAASRGRVTVTHPASVMSTPLMLGNCFMRSAVSCSLPVCTMDDDRTARQAAAHGRDTAGTRHGRDTTGTGRGSA